MLEQQVDFLPFLTTSVLRIFRNEFSTKVYFCWVAERDTIEQKLCDRGWNSNFELYGGSNQSGETITLYSYYHREPGSTNLYLRNDVNDSMLNFQQFQHHIPSKVK